MVTITWSLLISVKINMEVDKIISMVSHATTRIIASILLPLAMVGVRELMKRFGPRLSKR
jgi:hypothetical protein